MSAMIRCHLPSLMDRRKLRVADVARLTGLNRSTVTDTYQGYQGPGVFSFFGNSL